MQADISLSQELQEFKNQDPAKKKLIETPCYFERTIYHEYHVLL